MTNPARPTLLACGLGYSVRYAVERMGDRLGAVTASARTAGKAARLAENGIAAARFDGSAPSPALADLIAGADLLVVSAAPGPAGDPLLVHHAADVERAVRAGRLKWIGYLSTVGVYGDHDGAWIDETAELKAAGGRSGDRVEAERGWTALGERAGVPVALLRLAGIYGPARNAFVNLASGTARRIVKPGQVFNRTYVEDIAAVIDAAATRRAAGAFNVCDDEPGPPQDVIALAAAMMGLAPPPEEPFRPETMTPMARSFYAEVKRCRNDRIKAELGVALVAPTYREGLARLFADGRWTGTPEDRDEASPRFRRTS